MTAPPTTTTTTTTTSTTTPTRPRSLSVSLLFAAASMAAGMWAFYMTQKVTATMFEPILEACTEFHKQDDPNKRMDDFTSDYGYHAYDPRVAILPALNPFVCVITQFLYLLSDHQPAGLLAWGELMTVGLPMGVWTTLEAGRHGNGRLLLYPTALAVLYQFLGVSVIFPLIWVPAYCLTSHATGAVSSVRCRAAVPLLIPSVVLSVLVFVLDNTTQAWTLCAGILGGPLIAMMPLLLYRIAPPNPQFLTPNSIKQAADAGAQAFAIAGMAALVLHVWLLYETFLVYGFDYAAVWKDLWTDGHPAVQFMTVDAGILYVGMMLAIAYKSWWSFGEALVMTPMFGPGGACAMALAALEMESASAILRAWAETQQGNITKAVMKEEGKKEQ